jgi:hypothetical protein
VSCQGRGHTADELSEALAIVALVAEEASLVTRLKVHFICHCQRRAQWRSVSRHNYNGWWYRVRGWMEGEGSYNTTSVLSHGDVVDWLAGGVGIELFEPSASNAVHPAANVRGDSVAASAQCVVQQRDPFLQSLIHANTVRLYKAVCGPRSHSSLRTEHAGVLNTHSR